ncbi:DUF2855 domain-containing protein [Pseudomonas sp. FW306-02-F02-AA]|uniref:DUF2855 domain-containing protein n=1 Tax=Pseudomonas fluorescens TaxID=294 RepID=A0A0N9WPK4_PSEFL|nr:MULTISPECIES: DUF2855 family protein [Pseudomonas]ALI03903.1 hypothetical protein AO353_23585 [Pseudomonas fluorescens]PMZ04830.1 DUF2855 domain-containing protein [Pseudomonas sp. FW306-02-F02-AB]PMZ11994.1 DUF2855 domain-containing protein [Pseudomonas sp. FW306-02-H06C]PMZ17755.1 DUF2855 domain-containing protein [Pseudomonas sp. FW306-02-F02-AA]PMZ23787.1 DUF2855 domain-containing protein [Pseudomonas sp. FW306-02-F08-AA]
MQSQGTVTRLITRKNAIAESRIEREQRSLIPSVGDVILKIDRCALTSNNITYAAYGDLMHYWEFFPTGQAEWGHIPAWGFADVLACAVEGIAVGERFYGYFPLASHLWVHPERVTERGFHDAAPHRQTLNSVYNQYTRCSWDRYYIPANENLQMLLNPLFLTSLMLADFLQDNQFFGATRVVFSSASSKTAFGTAICLEDQSNLERVALTSTGNQAFVEQLGCYERTLGYAELASLPADRPTLYVDFSGRLDLRNQVHQHFAGQLVYSCAVGSTQNTDEAQLNAITGPQPAFFFAPIQIRKRNAEWGSQRLIEYIGEGGQKFYRRVMAPANPLLRVVESDGLEAAQTVISRLFHGQIAPIEGHVIRL